GTRRLVPGPEIHAAAVATLLSGRVIRPLDRRLLWAAHLVLACALIALAIRSRPSRAALIVVAVALGTYAVAQYAFAEGLWIRFVSTAPGVLLALPAVPGFRFVEARRLTPEAQADRAQLMGLFGGYVSCE